MSINPLPRYRAVAPTPGLDMLSLSDEELRPSGTVARHPECGEETWTPTTSARILESSVATGIIDVDERADQPTPVTL